MKLYFKRGNDTYFFLKDVNSQEEAYKEITKFLDHYNYQSFYTRQWETNNIIYFDVGSYTEFFILVPFELINNFENGHIITLFDYNKK